jgi:hypothetical protein
MPLKKEYRDNIEANKKSIQLKVDLNIVSYQSL